MNAKVQSVNHTSEKAIVAFTDSQMNEAFELEADAVLLATGRRPNTQGLHLEAAGVEVDARGAIIVDEYLKTTNPAIRAVGDVKGGLQFTYISLMTIGLSEKTYSETRSGRQATVIRSAILYLLTRLWLASV